MSAIVADAMLIPGLPKTPAKNLHITRAAMFWEKPEPSVNKAKIGTLVM